LAQTALRPAPLARAGPRRWPRRLLALAIGYLALETLVLPWLALAAPLRLSVRLPAPLYLLGASSKSGLLPRDWVLVLGDSFAAGYGDWLAEALSRGGRPPFQATHVLHERTGRDVLSFGTGGADSVSSTAFLASKRFAALRRVGLRDPSDVLVYFYEGNDLNDNLRLARRRFELEQRGLNGYSDADLERWIARRARAGSRQGLPGTLFAPYLLANAIRGKSPEYVAGEERSGLRLSQAAFETPPDVNAFSAGRWHAQLRGEGRGPALDLTEQETELALRLLAGSLRWTRRRFATARVALVYLPSPMATYEFSSPHVRVRSYEGRGSIHDSGAARARSDELRVRVQRIAQESGCGWIDATPRLRAAARGELLHGPQDFGHFNRAGYTLLGEILAEGLAAARR
jgi:lysophospholipase L1-like esterase